MFLCVASQFFFIISFFFSLSLSISLFMKLFMASAVSRTWCQESWAATFCETHIPFTRTHTEWIARACLCFDRLSNSHACAKFLQPNALCKINWSILCFAIGKRTDDGDGYNDDEMKNKMRGWERQWRWQRRRQQRRHIGTPLTHTTQLDVSLILVRFIHFCHHSFSIAHHHFSSHITFVLYLFSDSLYIFPKKIEPLTINHIITLDLDVCLEFCMCFFVLRALEPAPVETSQVIQTLHSLLLSCLLLQVYTFSWYFGWVLKQWLNPNQNGNSS